MADPVSIFPLFVRDQAFPPSGPSSIGEMGAELSGLGIEASVSPGVEASLEAGSSATIGSSNLSATLSPGFDAVLPDDLVAETDCSC